MGSYKQNIRNLACAKSRLMYKILSEERNLKVQVADALSLLDKDQEWGTSAVSDRATSIIFVCQLTLKSH